MKVYVELIDKNWDDDIGSRVQRSANDALNMLNGAAAQMEEKLLTVEKCKERQVTFASQTPKLLDLQKRLREELESR